MSNLSLNANNNVTGANTPQTLPNNEVKASSITINESDSLSLKFAKIQLAYAEKCKTEAERYMEKIQNNQNMQRECADMIKLARNGLAKNISEEDKTRLKEYMKNNGMTFRDTSKDKEHDLIWDQNITALINHQNTFNTTTQTDMVYLQDYIGQYNSYLQGANKTVTEANQLMQQILRNI